MADDQHSTLPKTCAEAKRLGSLHYFTGKPCKNGHVDRRLTSNQCCMECARQKAVKRYWDDPETMRQKAKARLDAMPDAERKEHYKQQSIKYAEQRRVSSKAWYLRNKPYINQRRKDRYYANRDQENLNAREWRERNAEHVKQYFKDRWVRERIPILEKMARLRRENPEFYRARDGYYREKYKDIMPSRRHRWYWANPEKHRERARSYQRNNPEKVAASYRRWYKNNPHRVRANVNKRRAMKINATPPWADLEAIQDVYEQAQRLQMTDGIVRHVDHIIPLRNRLVCGLHVHENLQILTADENLRKYNRFTP